MSERRHTKLTAAGRLKEWRDHGTGPETYCAGSADFGDDVKVLLNQHKEMLDALKIVAAQITTIDNIANQEACEAVRAAIAKSEAA